MSDDSAKNKRIARNTIFLYVRMFIVLIVGLYTSRVVLNMLGAADYGVYNVVAGFVSLFAFLNATLSSSIQRFYNYEGGVNGDAGYTKVFSVGIRVHLIMAGIVFLLLESFGIWYINNVMVLPEGRLPAANILFQFSAISMVLVILQIPYSGAIVAKERLDYTAFVSIADVLIKLLLVLLLPHIPYDKLIAYASIGLLLRVINFSLYVGYAKINFKFLKMTKGVDKALLKNIMSFSGWNLLGAFAYLLKGQGLNMLLNAFFGTVVNAARGIAYQINGAVVGFSNNISSAFRPQLVGSYAEGNPDRTFNLFLTQSKLTYCLILMLITPVILEMDYLLHLWLGDVVPDQTNLFAALVLIDMMLCTLNAPVTQVVFATGNIVHYQIYNSIFNLLLIPVCWVFLKLGYDAWIVFAITILFTIGCQIISLIVMHKVFPYSYKDYFKRIVYPCFSMTVLVPIVPFLLTRVMNDSFIRLALISIASLIMTAGLLYIAFLSKAEKNMIQQFIRNRKKKNK